NEQAQLTLKKLKLKSRLDQILDSKFGVNALILLILLSHLFMCCVLWFVDSEDRAAREEMLKIFWIHVGIHNFENFFYVAGYWLNLAFRFNVEEFEKHKKITSGLLDVIERYAYSDAYLNYKLTSEMKIFKNINGKNLMDVERQICKSW
ncbi:hypothetical protein S83_058623, partial [Arachis hypogaea]